jgi:hypothetical protein
MADAGKGNQSKASAHTTFAVYLSSMVANVSRADTLRL